MQRFFVALVIASTATGCSGDDGGTGSTYETLLDEDFAMFPDGWYWEGGAPQADPNYGFPAPSGFVIGASFVSPPSTFTFANQRLDTRVTSYLQNTQEFGNQYAVLRVVPESLDPNAALATVSYRLINNRQANTPIEGYPAGNTAEVHCSLDGGTPVHIQVPYTDGEVAYDLFITMDAQGTHCGFDDTIVANTIATSATGTFRLALGATASTSAWFDNLIMRRPN